MRIRKRWDSSSAFGNTKTCPSTPTQPQPYDAADSHQQQKHLLPLLQTTGVELADCTGPRQRHKQPSNGVHKWKQALQLNSEVMGEWSGDAVECKGISSSLRNQGENIGHASKQDKSVDTDEGSPENGIPSDHEEEWDVFKSSRFPKTSSSYTQQLVQLGEGSEYLRPVCSLPLKKRKRNMKESPSADDSHCGNGWRPDAKMFPVSIKRPKVIKADTGDEEWKDEVNSRKEMNKKNKTQTAGKMSEWSAGGSQCRRMNGRGWRCSQRTLVGYALCEHHLGKGRLKSINNTHHLHTTNASCKDLQLMPSNANLIESQDLGQEEKKKRLVKARSLKLISRNT